MTIIKCPKPERSNPEVQKYGQIPEYPGLNIPNDRTMQKFSQGADRKDLDGKILIRNILVFKIWKIFNFLVQKFSLRFWCCMSKREVQNLDCMISC